MASDSLPKLPINSGTIYYYIYNEPSHSDFRGLTNSTKEIRDALDCWERVSRFKFSEIPAFQESYSTFFPRINFRFGATEGLQAAKTEFLEIGPIEITFDDTKQWTSVRRYIDSGFIKPDPSPTLVAALSNALSGVPYDDLWTITLHEIGHALGLGHDANPNSIMFPLDTADSVTGYFMKERAIPVIDAIKLGKLYGIGLEALAPLPALASGYLIVGGKFEVTDKTRTVPLVADADCSWGVEEGHLALVGEGYCLNPLVGGDHRGYGYLYLYLLEPDRVDADALVATGGYQKRGPSSFQWTGLNLAHCDRVSNSDWGNNDSGTAQIFGHFFCPEFQVGLDAYRLSVLTLRSVGSAGLRVQGGWTEIGDSLHNRFDCFNERVWGTIDFGGGPVKVGNAQTHSQTAGKDYDFSTIFLFRTQ